MTLPLTVHCSFQCLKSRTPTFTTSSRLPKDTEAQQSSTSTGHALVTDNQALVPARFNEHSVYARQGEGATHSLTHSLPCLYASRQRKAPKVTGPISRVRKKLIPCLEPRQPSAPVLRPGFPLQPLIRHLKNPEMTIILPETILYGWRRRSV